MNSVKKALIIMSGGGLIVIIVALVLKALFGSPAEAPPKKAPPPLVDLKEGQTLTKSEVAEKGYSVPPVTKVDTGRLQATYQTGKTYINMGKVMISSKGYHKDWGIVSAMTFTYVGEFQVSRYIVANDGQTMTADILVDRACTISVFSSLDSLSFEMPPLFEAIFEAGSHYLGLPPGTSEITKQTLNFILDSTITKDFVSQISQDEAAKLFATVDSLQGKKARVVFENGKGVVYITPIGCTLTSDDQLFFSNLSIVADITTMQSLDSKPGDMWTVPGPDLIMLLDPSLKSNVGGSVSIVRRADVEGKTPPEALLETAGGVLTLYQRYRNENNEVEQVGAWAPQGQLIFSFDSKIFTEAKLTGSISIEERSVDHIIFEMKNVVKPSYEVHYSAWVADGNQLGNTLTIGRPVQEGTLDAIKGRLPKSPR